MTETEVLVRRFRDSQAELEQAVATLDEDQAAQVWYGSWGAKQIVAHIAGWNSAIAEALERIARGERPSAGNVNLSDVEGTNDTFAASAARLTFAQVTANLRTAANSLVKAIEGLPADRLEEGKTARRLVETMIGHPGEHIGPIRAWRAGDYRPGSNVGPGG